LSDQRKIHIDCKGLAIIKINSSGKKNEEMGKTANVVVVIALWFTFAKGSRGWDCCE
jgi:hypothetical protein